MEAEDDGIIFRSGWQANDPKIIEDVTRLWLRGGVKPAIIDIRIGEICIVAYSGDEVIAVATAYPHYDSHMRNKFFGYRCMTIPRFRQHNLAWRITAETVKVLQEWAAKHAADQRIMGLMTVFETDKYLSGARWPLREKFGITLHFVGYTPAGEQIRVAWFDGAMLDDNAAKASLIAEQPGALYEPQK